MMKALRSVALAAAIAAAAGAAAGGEAQDRLFALDAFEAVPTGARVLYDYRRTGIARGRLPPIDGTVELGLSEGADGAREVAVALDAGGRVLKPGPFPASAGNPLLMVFMETSVRSMAEATGGSPFYIRNRMREALRTQDERAPAVVEIEGSEVAAERLTFRPFEADPNRDRMGPFADLEIRFTLSDAVPGGYAALEAVAGPDATGAPAFAERMQVERVEDAR